MAIRATVRTTTGKVSEFYGTITDDGPVPVAPIPVPAWIEIREEPGGFFLDQFAADGAFLTDSWHQTLDDAKRQAEFEFAVLPSEWTVVES